MNSTIKTRISVALASALLLTGVAAASAAFADSPVRAERVKFQDLNVNTAEGVKALYGRIHLAAKRVCLESDPLRQAIETACANKAEADAVEKLNLSQLTAYYNAKTQSGKATQPLVASR